MLSCSVPFVQTNVQLLATCYLHNNQPYAAYHILKGNIICSRYYHPAVPGHYCVVMSLRFESKQLEYIVHFVGIFLILHFGLFFSFYIGVKVVWMIYGFFSTVNEGKKLPESRYLFAMSCFRMNLLREAEDTLCPVNEPNIEVCSVFVKRFIYVVAS